MDLEAGVEHLGRATAQGGDALLVVVDPDCRRISAAEHMEKLARQIGISRILIVGNKIEEDEREFAQRLPRGLPLLGVLPFSLAVAEAGRKGRPVPQVPETEKLWHRLEELLGEK